MSLWSGDCSAKSDPGSDADGAPARAHSAATASDARGSAILEILRRGSRVSASQVEVCERTHQLVDSCFPRKAFGVQRGLQDSLLGPCFSKVIIFVIVANCVEIGVSCQWRASSSLTLHYIYLGLEIVFTTFYSAEAYMKITKLGLKEYLTNGWANALDLLVVICGVLQIALSLHSSGEIPPTVVSTIKTISLLRILRIFRALRFLTSIPELSVTLGGLVGSLRTLGWVLFVLLLFMFAASVYFVVQINDRDSRYWPDLGTALQTMASVCVLSKWTSVLETDADYGPEDPAYVLLLLVPFYGFVIIMVFGVINIIIGVIVDATADTKGQLLWSKTRDKVVRVGAVWESHIVAQGLSVQALAAMPEPRRSEAIVGRQELEEAFMAHLLESEDMKSIFPPGMTVDEVQMLLEKDSDGLISHHEFCLSLGRLLLCDEVQLRVLALKNQGQLRRKLAGLSGQVSELTSRLNALEGVASRGFARMDAGFNEIKDLIASRT